MYDFRYIRPTTVAEAAEEAADMEAMFLGGGQSLLPMLKSRLAAPGLVVDLSRIAELKGVRVSADTLRIGGGTVHADVADHSEIVQDIPALAALAGSIGDMHVRNLGTLGGSLALNDPSADYPAALLALDGRVHTDRRDVPAADFITGMMSTDLQPGELIVAATFEVPLAAAYRKQRNPVSGFPMAGAFAARFPDGHRIGITGVGSDGAFRWQEAERLANAGGNVDDLEACGLDGIDVLSDMQASPRFRRHLLNLVTREAILALG
jgi:aerobic carbon-monoxide dehydrogenase medium subunit